jgi:CubicO group peptidase (beta-lactamase class C family)
MTVEIQGHAEPGFERVKQAFAENFEQHGEVGAAFAAYVRGRPVVDIWGGIADAETGAAWREDTLQFVYSTTKGATAICAHILAERGELDIDAPVARYWPEFAAEGKEAIPVRWLLSHRAGLAAIDRPITLDDMVAWTPAVDAIAAQAPNWEPGTAHGYHAMTFGYLVGEVVRRISGESLGTFFRNNVAKPLGLDFWIGLPQSEEPRASKSIPSPRPPNVEELRRMWQVSMPLTARVFSNPELPEDAANLRALHAAEVPAINGMTTARSVARMYAATIGEIDGVRLLNDETVASLSTTQSRGPDMVLGVETHFGLGFMLPSSFSPMGPEGCFGHPGAGGSVGFADPATGLASGYVMNRMDANLAGDPRPQALIAAMYASME